MNMRAFVMGWRMRRFVLASVTLLLALTMGYPKQRSALANAGLTKSATTRTIVSSTPIEKALDELRTRLSNSIVIGFEELFDQRPDKEPQVDLGPEGSSLSKVLSRIRSIDPKYRVKLLRGRLVHVCPMQHAADPVGLLDIRLQQFSMPQDSCLQSAIENIDRYAPELSQFLARREEAWYLAHHKQVHGVVGDVLGDCFPEAAPGSVYRNITVRDSLNLLVKRSLEVCRKEVQPNSPLYPPCRPLSWKFRFRRDAEADTDLGGRPVFQSF